MHVFVWNSKLTMKEIEIWNAKHPDLSQMPTTELKTHKENENENERKKKK